MAVDAGEIAELADVKLKDFGALAAKQTSRDWPAPGRNSAESQGRVPVQRSSFNRADEVPDYSVAAIRLSFPALKRAVRRKLQFIFSPSTDFRE